ncbi:hypothetical protein FA95DRAFT_1490826, partial [Auriscalpium vulgare]
ELPATVKSLNEGWLATFQTAATISGLLAVVQAQLISFVKNPANYDSTPNHASMQALLALTYCDLFLCLSATVSALILTDEFGELPVRASRVSDPIKVGTFDSSAASLLEVYGARKSWRWVMFHWLATLLLAVLCMIAQVALYVWLQESLAVKVTVVVVGVFGILPLLHFIPAIRGARRDSIIITSPRTSAYAAANLTLIGPYVSSSPTATTA